MAWLNRTHVYVAFGLGTGRVKIGMSSDPRRRVVVMQSAEKERIALFFAATHPRSGAIEYRSHELLAGNALGHEWFAVTPEAAVEAIRVAIIQDAEYHRRLTIIRQARSRPAG